MGNQYHFGGGFAEVGEADDSCWGFLAESRQRYVHLVREQCLDRILPDQD
jgi:hypothetical protein